MQIPNLKTKKGEICPICEIPMYAKNFLVIYHVRYGDNPIVILGCRFCNYTEYVLRTGKIDRIRCATPTRIYMIKQLHYKFGINL